MGSKIGESNFSDGVGNLDFLLEKEVHFWDCMQSPAYPFIKKVSKIAVSYYHYPFVYMKHAETRRHVKCQQPTFSDNPHFSMHYPSVHFSSFPCSF